MKIRALVFDADGVLLFHTDKLFSERLAEELQIDSAEILPFFKEVYPDCLIGKQDLKQAIGPYAKRWGWRKSVDELLEFWFEYERRTDQPLLDYIQQLRSSSGVHLYVATNNETYRATDMFTKLGFSQYFDGLYAAGTIGAVKPELVFFETMYADMSHIAKEAILFWDDSPANVDAARRFGLAAELYTDFEDFKAKMRQYVS